MAAMRLFFGAGLVTPAVLVSRGISFYSFLLLSGCVTLLVHLRTRNRQPVAVSPGSLRPPGAQLSPERRFASCAAARPAL